MYVFRHIDLYSMTLDFGEGCQLERYGHLRSQRKRLSRDDDVIMQLVLPISRNGNGLHRFKRVFRRGPDHGNFSSPNEICSKSTCSFDGSLQLILYTAELHVNRLWHTRIDRELKAINVVTWRKGPITLCSNRPFASIVLAKTPRLVDGKR